MEHKKLFFLNEKLPCYHHRVNIFKGRIVLMKSKLLLRLKEKVYTFKLLLSSVKFTIKIKLVKLDGKIIENYHNKIFEGLPT